MAKRKNTSKSAPSVKAKKRPALKVVAKKPAPKKPSPVKKTVKPVKKPPVKKKTAKKPPPQANKAKPAADKTTTKTAAADWQKVMQAQMDALRRAAGTPLGGQTGLPPIPPAADIFAKISVPWAGLMNNASAAGDIPGMLHGWLDSQRAFLELHLAQTFQSPDPAAFWQQSGPAGFADTMARMPGIGYTRKQQEDLARLYKSWTDHEKAQARYNAEMLKLALAALTRFQASLKNPAAEKLSFTSLKDVYAHWVNISEDLYGQFALTEDHAQIYAQMVDSQSAFKKEMNRQTDQWAAQLNLPTRTEVDSLHQRMHDLRRENRDLRHLLEKLAGPTKGKRR